MGTGLVATDIAGLTPRDGLKAVLSRQRQRSRQRGRGRGEARQQCP